MPSYDYSKLTLADFQACYQTVKDSSFCLETPLLPGVEKCLAHELPKYIRSLAFKLECLQNSGSFKIRGAVCQVKAYLDKNPQETQTPCCFVAYSGGNYGKAIAMVCDEYSVPLTVIMPNTVSKTRINIIRGYNATVKLGEGSKLVSMVKEESDRPGHVLVHPFDDLPLIAGYGSITFEVMAKSCEPDVILVPVGGGGLLAGISACARLAGWTKCKIFGVEPENADVMHRCISENRRVDLPGASSVAVGTCSPEGGKNTFPLCKRYTDGILIVTDAEIVNTLRYVYQRLRMVLEPTGVVALAALLHGKLDEVAEEANLQEGLNVLVVISGSNISMQEFRELVAFEK